MIDGNPSFPPSEGRLVASTLGKVYFSHAGDVPAYENVNLTFLPGQLSLLKGPSGSGKTSLLASLGGLLQPTTGFVEAFGKRLWDCSDVDRGAFRARFCGFVFQSVGLFPALTAREQITIPLRLLGFGQRDAAKRADQVLDEVGLYERASYRPSEMSGGQNQRVAVARMLAKSPRLIFCDEPTSSLDGDNSVHIGMLLRSVAESYNAIILCVTHDDRLVPCAHRVVQIEDGRIKNDSATSDFQ